MANDNQRPVVLDEVGNRLELVTIELAELKAKYEPVWMLDNGIAVRAAEPILESSPNRPSFREFGTTGQSIWTGVVREDYNAELRGKLGLQTYDRMRRSDGQVRATLRLVKTPVLAARWYVEPASDRKKDQTIAKFVWDNLTKWMTVSWMSLLTEILLMLDYGYYVFEKVFDVKDDKVIWRKFAPRHPLDVYEWAFDEHGGPKGVTIQVDAAQWPHDQVFLPIWKLALFTFDKEAGDVTGISVLRSAYKHWFFKENLYKIDAIQKERHGIGIPVIKLPANFNEQDRRLADEIGRNLRTNEKAHVVLPTNWDIAMLRLEGNPVDALASAEHHDLMIARNILGQFINSDAGTSQEEQQQLFLKATRYIAEIIRDVFNKYCIPQLVNWNWPNVDEYPELKVRRIGDTVDWRTISFAIRNFIGAGVIIPDEVLEQWVRDEMDLPKRDEETERIILPQTADDFDPEQAAAAGGGAPQAQLPRQAPAGNRRQGPGNNGNVGRDRSGG